MLVSEVSYIDYKRNEMIKNLKNFNYLAIGHFSFVNRRHQEPSASDERIKISKNYFKLLATKKKISLRDLDYYIKDELESGVDDPNSHCNVHFLLGSRNFDSANDVLKCLKTISSKYGRSDVQRYDYRKHGDSGIRYTAKTHKGLVRVANDFGIMSEGMRIALKNQRGLTV
jgi:hypothetical protein